MDFSETVVVYDLKLATDDRSDKKFLLTSKLCPLGAVCPLHWGYIHASRKLLRIKVTPDLHLTYSKNGGNLGLVFKMKNIACISILLTKHVK